MSKAQKPRSLGESRGDSADPSSTGAFKVGRVLDDADGGKSERGGCTGCFAKFAIFGGRLLGLFALSLTLPGALVVAGWSHLLTRRVVRWRFWRLQAAAYRGDGFGAFAATCGFRVREEGWLPPLLADWQTKTGALRWIVGLWRHAKAGGIGWLHTWVWYGPAALLFWSCFQSPWGRAFGTAESGDKPGMALGLGAVAIFAVSMRILPLVQARYSLTQDWRVFYDVKINIRLTRHLPANGLWLALLYAVGMKLAFELTIWLGNLTGAVAWTVWALAGFWLIGWWCLLRLACAWYYPRALRDGIRIGTVDPSLLHATERELIGRLSWPPPPAEPGRVPWPVRLPLALLQMAMWAIIAASMGAAVLAARPQPATWLHHPLIHAPWQAEHVKTADPGDRSEPDAEIN